MDINYHKRMGEMVDLKKIRAEMGMTLSEIALKMGVSQRTWQRWEKNPEMVSIGDLNKIEELLNFNFGAAEEKQSSELIEVPYYEDVRASMGNGILNHESEVRKIAFDAAMLRDIYKLYCTKGLSLINAYGDSMVPTIPSDSIVFIQKGDGIPDGSICAAMLDGELYIKRLQKRPVVKLISDNKEYDPITIHEEDDFIILGKVIGVLKTI